MEAVAATESRQASAAGAPPVNAYLASFAFVGIAANLAGPALSYLRDRVGTDNGGIALVFATQAAGYVAGSLAAGHWLDRGRGHRLVSGSIAIASMSVVAVVASRSLVQMAAAFLVLGVACALIDVSGNALVVWSRPGRSDAVLNALHLWFALGALCTPLLVDRALAWTHSLWPVLVPLGVLTAVCATVLTRTPAPARSRAPLAAPTGAVPHPRSLQIAAVCLFFFCYVGLETGFAGWIHSYVEQIHYGGAAMASGVTAAFWAGFVTGRAVAVRLAGGLGAARLLALSVGGTLAAALAFWLFRGPGPMLWLVTFGFAVTVAPQYASMMAFAETRLALSGRSTSAMVAASGLGILVLPWLLGQMFDAWGPGALPPTMVVAAVVTAVAAAVVARVLPSGPRPGQRPPATSSSAPVM